ncbi:MAG: DUF4349 domain-containing protein [Pirellulaceae bacterium]
MIPFFAAKERFFFDLNAKIREHIEKPRRLRFLIQLCGIPQGQQVMRSTAIVLAAGLIAILFTAAGCSRYEARTSEAKWAEVSDSAGDKVASNESSSLAFGREAAQSGIEAQNKPQSESEGRYDLQIIYTAYLSVSTEDFEPIPDAVSQMAKRFGGYISKSDIGQMQGSRRRGQWTLRIPVENYRAFLESASGLGVPQSLNENADDVTEEFYDLTARITSAKKLEEQIMKLLERETEKIDDLIAVERELSRVRLEIERMEGRVRFLKNQVSLSTVHLTVSEVVTYVPEETPDLGHRVGTEWSEAKLRLQRWWEYCVLWTVANTFVIIAWIIALPIAWWISRRAWKGLTQRTSNPANDETSPNPP